MERHLDLVRTILLELEQHQEIDRGLTIKAPGFSPEQIAYHVKLLHEAGYVEAMDLSTLDGSAWRPMSLTWQGHEFLDATRNDRIWQKIKAELKDRGMKLPFILIQDLALKLVKAHFGLGSGK